MVRDSPADPTVTDAFSVVVDNRLWVLGGRDPSGRMAVAREFVFGVHEWGQEVQLPEEINDLVAVVYNHVV